MNNNIKRHSLGFTLIEVLVVIAILVVLMAIVIIAINPTQQILKARNLQRKTNTRELTQAIAQWSLDNNAIIPTSANGTPYPMVFPGYELAKTNIDLCAQLIPRYLAEMPVDPTFGAQPVKDCTTSYRTGYKAYTNSNNAVSVVSSADYYYGPLGYWDFNEGTGSTVTDRSGSSNTGRWSGGGPYWGVGQTALAGTFNGTDTLLTAGSTAVINNQPAYSVCLWFKTGMGGIGKMYSESNTTDVGHYIYLSVNEAGNIGKVQYAHGTSGAYSIINSSAAIYTTNVWTHVCAIQYGRSSHSLYVNGVLNTSDTSTLTLSMNLNKTVIGGVVTSFPFQYFNGLIDDVRVFGRALTDTEITQLYNYLP